VCGFSTFDFEKYGDELWEGRTIGTAGADPFAESLSESIMRIGNVEEATRRFPKPKAREGKMEKSFFSFKVRKCIAVFREFESASTNGLLFA
jgi:hypothetical protein